MIDKPILVIHHAADVRERFAAALTSAGHQVSCAATREEVHAALADGATTPALVLADAKLLPARETGAAGGPPVVVFSSSVADAAEARAWAAAGVRGWLNEQSAPHQILAAVAPVLFRDNFDRRASPRVPVAMAVSCTVEGIVSSATALNLGAGGLALRTLTRIAVGTPIALRFRLPSLSRDVEADARVCWTDVRFGLGAQFERIADDDLAAIESFVERHGGG